AAYLKHLLQDDKLLKQASSGMSIEADAIGAYNVVSGVQQINVLNVPKQPWRPPLQRPRRAEYFVGREAERASGSVAKSSGIKKLCGNSERSECVEEWHR